MVEANAVDVGRMDIDGLMPTIPRVLRARAREFGPKKFLVCDSDVLTYAEADRRSAQLARGLLAIGIGKGSHVGLIYPNGPEFVVSALAAARIGAVALPFSTMSTAHELQSMFRGADVRAVLSSAAYRSHDFVAKMRVAVPELAPESAIRSATVPTLRYLFFSGEDDGIPPEWRIDRVYRAGDAVAGAWLVAAEDVVRPADRLVIVHTSGSTSEPKAVIHTHGGMIRHMKSLDIIRRYDSNEILFSNNPCFWIGGYASNFVATLEAGATLICSNARDAGETLDLIERERPTFLNGFSQSYAYLAEHPSFPSRDLSSIRRGNLYPIMPAAVRPADPELRHNLFGMTEAGSVCLISEDESEQPEERRGSFGHVAPGFEARIVNPETGRECPPGEAGELHLRGPFLMEGYYGREKSSTFDADGWYATGDIMTRDRDGFFYFSGRLSEMIKTSGANVSPREVEGVIHDLTGLVAHVVGVDDPDRGQLVAAAVVTADPVALDVDELRKRLAERLSTYKIPRRICAMATQEVPIMSSGKVDLRSLREMLK